MYNNIISLMLYLIIVGILNIKNHYLSIFYKKKNNK